MRQVWKNVLERVEGSLHPHLLLWDCKSAGPLQRVTQSRLPNLFKVQTLWRSNSTFSNLSCRYICTCGKSHIHLYDTYVIKFKDITFYQAALLIIVQVWKQFQALYKSGEDSGTPIQRNPRIRHLYLLLRMTWKYLFKWEKQGAEERG